MSNQLKPLSLYVHIPFCIKKCNYCDFLSFASDKELQREYVQALLKEIKSYGDLSDRYSVNSIFLGGGTPSSLETDNIVAIIELIKATYSVAEDAEVTIEANPGTLTKEKLETYKAIGINRISLGLQSDDNEMLKRLGRIHTYETFLESFNLAREVGFDNLNIDLMFGLPDQTVKEWEATLAKIAKLESEHISTYSLIIEEGTPLFEANKNKELNLPTDFQERKMYHSARKILEKNGLKQYEISNFSTKGKESYHNKSYWLFRDYLGLGIGAASFIDNRRYKNSEDMDTYLKSSDNIGEMIVDEQILSRKEQLEEFMFLGLRMTKGISKIHFRNRFGTELETVYGEILDKLQKEKLLKVTPTRVLLTTKGTDLSNYVFEKFLMD